VSASTRDRSGSVLRFAVGALALALISACAGSPPRASATQQPASGNQLVSAGTPAPTPASAADPLQTDNALRKRGYQPATFRGERVYCRKEPLTGSNLETKVCRTAKQIEDEERAGKDVLNGNHPAGCMPKTVGCE
jgi:hypothetical protein